MTGLPTQPEYAPDFPRITPYIPAADDADPRWPDGWGDRLTERDVVGEHLTDLLGEMRVPLRGVAQRGVSTVNLLDYRPANLKGWGAGWPGCAGATGNIVAVTADRSGARFNVHRRVAVLFDHLIDRMEGRGYLCKPTQCGAYNCRAISGTQVASNHSWGLAADVNWTDNPFTTTGQRAMPDWVPLEVFNPYGWAWGGAYVGARKDYMHLEFLGSPTQADEQTSRVLAEVTPKPGHATIQRGSTGPDVELIQRFLGVVGPGDAGYGTFGPATEAAVIRYQTMRGLVADGVVGPTTWRETGL